MKKKLVPEEHKAKAPKKLGFAIIVCSTSRFSSLKKGEKVSDPAGELIVKLLREAGHNVSSKKIVPDDRILIEEAVKEALSMKEVDVVITCGGTGIAPSDVTIETVRPLLEKELPGFGEILRRISYDEIGSSSMLTRSLAGTVAGKVIFSIPGSPHAAGLAVKELILKEAPHIVMHVRSAP